MGVPLFKLKLCYPDGSEILFNGAGRFERDMVRAITDTAISRLVARFPPAVCARGVGFWHTEAHVAQDVTDVIREVLPEVIEESIKHILRNLKEETVTLVR